MLLEADQQGCLQVPVARHHTSPSFVLMSRALSQPPRLLHSLLALVIASDSLLVVPCEKPRTIVSHEGSDGGVSVVGPAVFSHGYLHVPV